MHSPGIDKWIQSAPKSWAKLAKDANKQTTFAQFKKKFFDGAKNENKEYLKKYLTNEQLQHIYTQGAGGIIQTKEAVQKTPTKPTVLKVERKGKVYQRTNLGNWSKNLDFVLKLASQAKLRSKEYYEYRDILVNQGRSEQAVTKKIQRTRRDLNE